MIVIVSFLGCATLKQKQSREAEDMTTALQSVAGALAGQELTAEDIKSLKKEIQTNDETRHAVKEITDSLQQPAQVKYCPIDGQRYSAGLKLCPVHHVELKEIQKE